MADSDCVVFMGSNMAENHPVAFRWPMKAKVEHGAQLIHVDPRFTRTSAMCDLYAPIRAGSDIAFLGGLIIDFLGRPEDRRLARLGYYIAFPAVVVSGILLIADLSRPERFWHMMLQSETWRPMFTWWSPISFGSWALLAFGLFTFVSFLAALEESGRLRRRRLHVFRPPHVVGALWAILGGTLGVFAAGYTGVLLSVTNRPIWAESPLLGLVFLPSRLGAPRGRAHRGRAAWGALAPRLALIT